MHSDDVSSRVGHVLRVILLCMLAILLRTWYLSVVQHEKHVEEAHKPQRRTTIEHMGRASIRDRFNLPLALNKVQYHAAVCYSHLRQIPSVRWEKDASGKKIRVQARIKHIKDLSQKMGDILHLDPLFIEDIIHAKAALVPHAPFVIKEDISEMEYFRLRGMEKDWPGLVVQRSSRRFYPRGKIGCDVLGTMGAISGGEYEKFTDELAELEAYVASRESGENPFLPKGFASPFAVRQRLLELQERAYTIQDFVGRTGIESAFDGELRGYSGRKIYEVDVKGNFLRELPGSRPPLPGQRLLLTISAELQEYAEQLLAESEATRVKKGQSLEDPWIKGGAIVAIDPRTGEVLALASHPRYDPNDFVSLKHRNRNHDSRQAVRKWLESEAHIGEIWDGKVPLERELFDRKTDYTVESMPLTWGNYLDALLPPGTMREALKTKFTIRHAVDLQRALMSLVRYSGSTDISLVMRCLCDPIVGKENPEIYTRLHHACLHEQRAIVERYTSSASDPMDKLLIADLCRLAVPQETMPNSLLEIVGSLPLDQLFLQRQAYLCLAEEVREKTEKFFIANDFAKWREKHFKAFLKAKRREEKENGQYAKPYTDFLHQLERQGFAEYWKECHLPLILKEIKSLSNDPRLSDLSKLVSQLSDRNGQLFLTSLRAFKELDKPLWGRYPRLRNEKGVQLQRHLAASYYPVEGFGYGRSQAFRQSTPAGSVFKMVIAYQALLEKYNECVQMNRHITNLNPLVLTDFSPQQRRKRDHETVLGRTSDGKSITRLYKGGRMPRSSHAGIGQVDLLGALEQSSNIYFSILAAEEIHSPQQLIDTARMFGYGLRTGIELPGEIPGNLPDDIGSDKTATYAFAIGQHTLVVTPLQTAMMIGAITGNGQLLRPSIVQLKAGKQRILEEEELFYRTDFPYREDFAAVGIHFPLFTSLAGHAPELAFSYAPVQVNRTIFIPPEVRSVLLEGMRRVVNGPRGTARASVVRACCPTPSVYQEYVLNCNQLVGKTGTAEILYKHTVDRGTKAVLKKHTWFAAASFPHDQKDKPELVVVVYLRFAEAGREAAPLASQIIKKWRDIRTKYGTSSHIAIEK